MHTYHTITTDDAKPQPTPYNTDSMSASFRRIERRPRPPPGQAAAGQAGRQPPASIGGTMGTVTAAAAAPLRAPGTRPWVNGQSLVSSGNRDLDGAYYTGWGKGGCSVVMRVSVFS